MILFSILAALLVIAALIAILPSAIQAPKATSANSTEELDQLETNIRIAKERRVQLKHALDSGSMDEATYATEYADLENSLAHALSTHKQQSDSTPRGWVIAGLIALFLPIASGALYVKLGTPQGINTAEMHKEAVAQQQQQQSTNAPGALTDLLPTLEKKLEENPEDRAGWKLLGKSYLTIGEFAKAKRALLAAYELDNQDADLLAQLAEASAMEKNGDLSGQATSYLDQALTLDENHQGAQWLRAIASQQSDDHEDALARFNTLRASVSDNPQALASIDEIIVKSQAALGITVTKDESSPSETTSVDQSAAIVVSVSLSEEAKSASSPDDAVFIFARAMQGPPMPLAVSKHTVAQLPITITLDDSMAMMPGMMLSAFEKVKVSARISKTGDAIAAPGDWFAEQGDITVDGAAEITLQINQQTP